MVFSEQEKKDWSEARETGSLPNGIYRAMFEGGRFNIMKKDGSKKLCLKYQVRSPLEHAGTSYTHFLSIDTKQQMHFTKKALVSLGLDADTALDCVEDELEKRVGAKVEFELFQNGQYQNCKLLGLAQVEEEVPF